MPTYSYRCTNCNHAFDIHQAFTDDNLTAVCPNCGGTLRKVFSPVGVSVLRVGVLPQRQPRHADAKSESKSETKTETKPETKTGRRRPRPRSRTPQPSS